MSTWNSWAAQSMIACKILSISVKIVDMAIVALWSWGMWKITLNLSDIGRRWLPWNYGNQAPSESWWDDVTLEFPVIKWGSSLLSWVGFLKKGLESTVLQSKIRFYTILAWFANLKGCIRTKNVLCRRTYFLYHYSTFPRMSVNTYHDMTAFSSFFLTSH